MTAQPKKRGAPPGNRRAAKPDADKKPRIKYVSISIHPDDAARWAVEAESLGLSLAGYVKMKCG